MEREDFLNSVEEKDERLEALKQLYPEIFSDGKINLDAFKEATGTSDLLEGEDKTPGYYGLYWPGKSEAKQLAKKPATGTLEPVPGDGVNEENTHNIYIEGDNLEVLRILRTSYRGRVKMIYIDPPYNTGNDFIYPDNFKEPVHEYLKITGQIDEMGKKLVANPKSSGAFHRSWLNMMYPRLSISRELLSDDGFMFVSIDYNENFNTRQLLNEIMGEENFVGEIYWESKTKSQNTTTSFNKLQPKAEMILVYSKNGKARFNLIETGKKDYPFSDDKGSYREYPLEVMNANGIRGRETMVYGISDGINTVYPPEGKQWQIGKEQMNIYKEAGDLFIREKKVIVKMRPEYERSVTTEPFWGFFSKELGTTESGKKELNALLENHGFDTVKPVEILRRLIHHSTDPDSIVLDFFSGSASTAHALFVKNLEDNGRRKFILIQIPVETEQKSDFKNICEIGKERIRRVGEKIVNNNNGLFLDNIDVGFKVYRLTGSNFTKYTSVTGQTKETLNDLLTSLDMMVDPLIDGWKPENVLEEIKLRQGFALDCLVEEVKEISSNKVWHLIDPDRPITLYVCLDETIDQKTVDSLNIGKDDKFICLNSAIDDTTYARLADKNRIQTL